MKNSPYKIFLIIVFIFLAGVLSSPDQYWASVFSSIKAENKIDLVSVDRKIISTPLKISVPDYDLILERFKGDVIRVPSKTKTLALSFDGGGNADGLKKILAVLKQKKIHSTFFLTGHFIETYPKLIKVIIIDGHEIANHTVSHKNFTTLTSRQKIEEITGMTEMARQQDITVVPFFRFPYGEYNKGDLSLVNGAGYTAVRWTIDSLGWQGRSFRHGVQSVVSRIVSRAAPGDIVLMHVGSSDDKSTLDADALLDVIRRLSAQGYNFTTLSKLFGSVK
ncbi:polysaccharide deacetylase family protein [Candidatus Azambacteria bacterium]|nr:polysaccharide deacetylase family protein [Candidatus Azambacteria bacterium]